jgi:heat shock protein HtpX
MAIALTLLAATYGVVWFGVYELFHVFPSWWPYWICVSVALAFAMGRQYRNAGQTLLAAVGAEPLEPGAEPELEAKVQRLASLADIPPPRLAVVDTDAANAFALSLGRRKAVVVITRGIREQLTDSELEASLGHEIAHLANHDAAVMTAVAAPRILGQLMVGGDESELNAVWVVIWPLGLPIYAVGALLTLTVSRYREFAADRGSALLAGTPGELMSALTKLSGHAAEIPHDDLRAANAFCIVSTRAQRFALFSDHPPLEKRLAALSEIAREMGKPVA